MSPSATKGYTSIPLTFGRKAVIASVSVTKEKNAIHAITEVDISEPRRRIQEHFDNTGVKLSFTAYLVCCFARVIRHHPQLNSFIRGHKLILLDDITVSVLIEREMNNEKVPEPIGIKSADQKTHPQIHSEIRATKEQKSSKLGSLSGIGWLGLIPSFLLKTFIRLADRNIRMAKLYGKLAVTAVGMYSKNPVWFIPHGSATVLLTIGSINSKVVEIEGNYVKREHLCITVSFDHNIVDGAPAARFMDQLMEEIKSGRLAGEAGEESRTAEN